MAYTTPGKTREQVYRYVRKRLIDGNPPTVREVQDEFGFKAVQSARAHLEILVKEGKLIKQAGKSRGYSLPRSRDKRKRPTTEWVPVIGYVQAGPLTEAIENPDEYIPAQSKRGARLFALRVRGDSMTGVGILNDDYVIVRMQPTANSGDIVVARVRDEATVKRLRLRRGRVELHAENADYEPIVPDPERMAIMGVVVEVRRDLSQ